MPNNYSTAIYSNSMNEEMPKKIYAKVQYIDFQPLDKFSAHIANHGSKYDRAYIYASLMQVGDCIHEMFLKRKRLESSP